jgi:hypothetical protein
LSEDVTVILIGEWYSAFVAALSGVKADPAKSEVDTVHSVSKGEELWLASEHPWAKDAENADN